MNTLFFTNDGQFLIAGGTRESDIPAISASEVNPGRHVRYIPTYARPVFVLQILFAFGSDNAQADLNGDGTVDDADLLDALFHFGQGC